MADLVGAVCEPRSFIHLAFYFLEGYGGDWMNWEIVEIGDVSTWRAKVKGGWFVRTVCSIFHSSGGVGSAPFTYSESSFFYPDTNHEWILEAKR